MSFVAYLKIENEDGTHYEGFTGEKDQTNDGQSVEKMSRIQEIDHLITVPKDQHTGEITGSSHHDGYEVTINVDKSLCMLYKAMVEGHRLNIKAYFFRLGKGETGGGMPDSKFHNWFTVQMEDCRIIKIQFKKATAMERDTNIPDLVALKFSYYKIIWTDHDDGQECQYEWRNKAGA